MEDWREIEVSTHWRGVAGSYPGTRNARRRLCFIEGAVNVEEANEAHKGALKLLPSFATAAQRLRND